jgi:large subunit ribosomal protein L22
MSQQFVCLLKKVRISPRKARLVADAVRGKKVQLAQNLLVNLNKKAAGMMNKMIVSAVANANQQATVDMDRLYVDEIYVNEGPTEKRFLPRAQGRATPIRKRTSHITVKLCEN